MLRLLPLLLATLAATACAPLAARPLVEVAVIDRDSGQWLDPTWHRGQHWIAGTPGHRYTVRLTNTSDRRVLVVLSVDGINAVTGQTAHPSQTGYVLAPWQSTQINGWRKSFDEVAQFVFTDLPDSYAARTGRPDNVGVIGVAVFEEARPRHYKYEAPTPIAGERRAQAKAAAPTAESAADAATQSLGTGHGEREWSQVSRTDFVRATRAPAQVSQWCYDDRAALVARGVLPSYPHHSRWSQPQAFPDGFVVDPPQY